jgi:protocatechuate 3,4-dioxygenase beta subunit
MLKPTTPVVTGSIAGNVWNDANGSQVRDGGEGNLAGRKMFIDLNKNGVLDANEPTTLTDASGNFKFSNLAAGTYRLREAMPSGWRVSTPSNGFRDVTVAAGANVTGQTFGDTQKVLISGNVFNDLNSNGAMNAGEALSGWRVYVDLNNNGRYDANEPSAVTDSTGKYVFRTLSAGSFRLRVNAPSTFHTSTPASGVANFTLGAGGIATRLFGVRHI